MASKEEDNKPELNSNVNNEQKIFLINVYKKHDVILNSKTESFERKIQSIIQVWYCTGELNLVQTDRRYVGQIMDWAKLHTLDIVLTAEWKDYKATYEASLLKEIEKVELKFREISTLFSARFQKLADVVRNPWEDPTLVKLLSKKDTEIGQDEIEFFCVETAYLVSYRLKKLCESQCEDLALNLVTAFMKFRELSKSGNFNLNGNEIQIWFIFDIYIALLYKFQDNQKIVSLLKELSLEDGLQLIRRFAKKQVRISKVWKNCHKIAILACQVFISTAAVKFSDDQRDIVEGLLDSYITICNTDNLIESFTTSLKRMSQLADASGLYVFCDVVHRKAGIKLKPFTIEMYIRALTADMNNLERQKNDNETDKVTETTKRLAHAFCKLADLLDEHVKVSRECVLTAFSLEPTHERLERIIELAKRSGFEVLDTGQGWKCKLHPPHLDKDELAWICTACGDWMSKPQLNIPLNTNIALNEALQADDLGISPQLCDDLAVCLSNPRYQILSWLLPWEDLHQICVMYTNDPERTKNIVTELKFIDIDYSIFKDIKREPVDELAGIEKGYEQYLDHDFTTDDHMSVLSEDSVSQDSRPYSLGSDGSGDTLHLPSLTTPKSDPNTLKSLRMFRPSLKRSKPIEPGQSVPEKLYKIGITNVPPKQNTTSRVPASMHIPEPTLQHASPSPSQANYTPFSQSQPDLCQHYNIADPKNGLVAILPPHHGWQVATNQTQQITCQVNPQTSCTNTNVNNQDKPLILNSTLTFNHQQAPADITLVPQQTKVKKPSKKIKSPKRCYSSGTPESSRSVRRSSSPSRNNRRPLIMVKKPLKIKSVKVTHIHSPTETTNNSRFNTDSQPRPDSMEATTQASNCTSNSSTISTSTPASDQTNHNVPMINKSALDIKNHINQPLQLLCNKDGVTMQELIEKTLGIPEKMGKCHTIDSKINYQKYPVSGDKFINELKPKNKNLTENIRTYARKRTFSKDNGEMIDCVTKPKEGDQNLGEVCKDVNSIKATCDDKDALVTHSINVQNFKCKLKELTVVLNRIPGDNKGTNSTKTDTNLFTNKRQKHCNSIDSKGKGDRGSGTQKYNRRRKSNDKSENDVTEKAPKRVQSYKLSPLQDINPRVPSENNNKNSKGEKECDLKKLNQGKDLQVRLERLPDSKLKPKSVFDKIPGLNDFQLMRPAHVNPIVNVVQISGGRPTSNVTAQNTQTSTQVTPHIQRIGQPRTEKPEQTNTDPSTTTSTNASTIPTQGKPTTSQPSTLINILSQQIIRPGPVPASNCVRTRSSPLINILSQQIIRPNNPQTVQKVPPTNSTNATSESQINNVSKVTTTTTETLAVNTIKNVAAVKNVVTTPTSGQGGTILQFICKSSSLPKFQQAFGKSSVYANNSNEASDSTSATTVEVSTPETNKKQPTTMKNIPVNVQPIQGSVIYTRQMPVGQAINLIPPGRGQVFRIATSSNEQISLVKDTVIHSKMSALLAAALQGKKSQDSQADGEVTNTVVEDVSRASTTTTPRPALVQNTRVAKPAVQVPSNVIRTSPQSQSSSLSSTTLEQLREFDMVYKQIKERSSSNTSAEVSATTEGSEPVSPAAQPQRISVTYVNQGQKYTQLSPVVVVSSAAYCNLQPAASPALSVTSQGSSSPCVTPAPASTPTVAKVASKSSKGKTLKNSSTTHTASKSSPIPKPQQKPQEDEHTTQRIFDILAEYAEQLRNSPDLNNKPAPRRRSNPPTNPSQNSKRKKSSSSKSSKSGQCSTMASEADTDDQRTMESEDSSCGVVQLSVPEEEPQVQTVTTTESNDSMTSTNSRQLILTSSDSCGNNQPRNLIIADSSVGEALKMPNTAVLVPGNYIMPVSMVKGGQQIAVVSGGSKILATVPARSGAPNMLLFQSFLNQSRKTGVPTVKYSTIQPLSGISSQSLAGVSAQPPVILPSNSHNLAAVTLGQPLTLKKVEEGDKQNTELLLTISQPKDNIKTEPVQPQPDSTNILSADEIKQEDAISSDNNCSEKQLFTYTSKSIITSPIATPVIAQAIKEEITSDKSPSSQDIVAVDMSSNEIKDEIKVERVQSVLVTACTSNGPMLSHTPPRYRKPSEICSSNSEVNSKEFLHNGDKQISNSTDQKHFATHQVYYQNKNKKNNSQRLDREIHQLSIQRKQAALERELRLQKSLSEECEDLGVDEPSTSDLFPEADLLFDSNHSPSFDQSSQDLMKRPQQMEIDRKDGKSTITLFSDDDNSSSLRTNLFEYVDEYPTADNELVFDSSQQLTNGQSSTSNESASSCEDNTLLQNCASMSDVTLNSPLSPPDIYTDTTPPSINKYKFKYSNRKKGERDKQQQTENWSGEVSSSDDTTGSTELEKVNSPEPEHDDHPCGNKRSHSISCDDELSDGSFKVVRVAISKTDIMLKDDESCEEHTADCEEHMNCSPSGRGARRSVKKMCSCCNGSQEDGVSRKRPTSRPHTPSSHKKAFLNKKR